jgi:5'(3')-deoxyribonucleotidase
MELGRKMFKLGLDADGVLIDNCFYWNQLFKKYDTLHKHGEYAPRANKWDYWNDLCKECFDQCLHLEDVHAEYVPVPGVPEMIKTFVNNDIEVNIVTSVPSDVTKYREKWVKTYLHINGNLYIEHDKAILATELGLDLMVDDAPRNILDFQDEKIPYIIFNQLWNEGLEGPRVHSIKELTEKVLEISRQ